MPGEWHTGAGVDQPARVFVVGAVPELRRVRAMRELQHLNDASQTAEPAGMPLLRFDPADTEAVSKMPVEICLFFWRRLRASGRETSQRISWRANRAAGPGYGADEAAVSGNAGCVRRRGPGHSRWHANAGEGTRLSAGDAGRRGFRGFVAEPAGFSGGGTHVSVADASCRACGAWRVEGARADPDILSRALRDSRWGEAGLQRILRERVAFPADDGVSAVHVAGQCDRARY